MEIFNISILENLSEETTEEEINRIFLKLCEEIQESLNLEIIDSNINIIYRKGKYVSESQKENFLDFGVIKRDQNESLIIEIFDEYKKYLPIILLREAFYCFVPYNLKENVGIKIIINQIVEINLDKFEIINEWNTLFKKNIVDYNFLVSEFDRLEKFLRLQASETTESSIKMFFQYIRQNILIIDDETEDLHDNILKDFILKTSKSLNNNEVIETLRILIKIFYKVKSYRALLEYQQYFTQFKENGEIKTDLSLRKFSSNIRWINKFTNIAPSYHIHWRSINAGAIFCKLCFNPFLDKAKIDLIIEKLPFFIYSKSSESYFSVEVSGWFVFPLGYQKDLLNFLSKLESFGYIIKKVCCLIENSENFLNLNYFREFYKKGRIINPNHTQYNEKYEIDFKIDFYRNKDVVRLSILDYVILNRLPYWSTDGFSFERRAETLRKIKSDLFNEILSQTRSIKKLRKNIEIFHENSEVQKSFLQFLKRNQNFGFFYIKELLKDLIISIKFTKTILSRNPNIKSIVQFQDFVDKKSIGLKIDEFIIFNKKNIKKIIYQDLFPIYFQNRKEFNNELNKYRIFTKVFESCYRLKIFDLKAIVRIIEDKTIVKRIYSVKEQKLRKILQEYKLQNITSNIIDNIIDSLLNENSSVIKPFLVNTINTTNFAKYYIEIILNDNSETKKVLEIIKKKFPRVVNDSGIELFTNENLRLVQIFLPNINENEKRFLVSILFSLFKEDLISLRRYFYDGFLKSIALKEFYDLDKQEFFYTADLFEQYFIYVQKILGNNLKTFKELSINDQGIFWSPKKKIENLINQVNNRISREQNYFNINYLNELLKFHLNLKKILLESENFKEIKKKDFFIKYVKSIKFKPTLQNFGLGQYYMYIRPTNMNEINYKLLFINTFQKVKYPAYIEGVQSLFLKFIFPHRNLNKSYLNWLTKSKKIISEYCVFFIKKCYILFHFDYNLESSKWDLNSNRFKSYMQKILGDPSFNLNPTKLKDFNIGDLSVSNYLEPNSPYFKNLTEIFGWNLTDLKSVLGTKNISLIEKIKELISKDLIFPYIKLKNLDFQDKIYIILPSLSEEKIAIIINIFKFFNYGFIYEMEGEYYIQGFPEEKKFENGLMIKLYLPISEISDFQRIFDSLFHFLDIKKYLILTDMVDGSHLIRTVFGNLEFLKDYNPLMNLIWNDKDKIWLNHKLFNEKFEPKYPELI